MSFIEVAETLKTINLVPSLAWGAWPLPCLLALVLIILLATLFYWHWPQFVDRRLIMMILILLVCLPIAGNNFFIRSQEILTLSHDRQLSVKDKLSFRLCLIDDNQLGDKTFCYIGAFYDEIKKSVPAKKKIALASSGVYSLVLRTYLLPDYNLTSLEDKTLDYFLIYLTPNKYQIASGGDLLELLADGRTINHGRFEVVRMLNQSMVILKKL